MRAAGQQMSRRFMRYVLSGLMRKALTLGAVYFAIVFAAAFALGIVRTFVVTPVTGPLIAVLLEVPLVVGGSWLVARHLLRHRQTGVIQCATMGGFAFGLLMIAECTLAVVVFGQSASAWASALFTPIGLIGLSAQIVFGLIPLLARQAPAQG